MPDDDIGPIFEIMDDPAGDPGQVSGNFVLFLLAFGIKNGCSTPAHFITALYHHSQYKIINFHYFILFPSFCRLQSAAFLPIAAPKGVI